MNVMKLNFTFQKIKSQQQEQLGASQQAGLRASPPLEPLVESQLDLEPSQLELQVESQLHPNLLLVVQSLLLLPRVELLEANRMQVVSLLQLLVERLELLEESLEPLEESLQQLLEAKLELLELRLEQVQEKLEASRVPELPEPRNKEARLPLVASREQEPNQQQELRGQQDLLPRGLLLRSKPVEQQLLRREAPRRQELRERLLARPVPRALPKSLLEREPLERNPRLRELLVPRLE